MGVNYKDRVETLTEFAEKLAKKVPYYNSLCEYDNAQFYLDCTEQVYAEIERIEEECLIFEETPLYKAALRMFSGDKVMAHDWMITEVPSLGGERPIDCDEREVLDLIGRIQHGVFC